MKKRILSLWLVFVLCLSLLPMSAFAAESIDVHANYESGSVEVTWEPVEGASRYACMLCNTKPDGTWAQMPDTNWKYVWKNDELKCHLSGFTTKYGNGGNKYKILVVAQNGSYEEIAEGYSNEFEVNIPILPAPESVTLRQDGTVTCSSVTNASEYIFTLYNDTGHSAITPSRSDTNSYDFSEYLAAGSTYYASAFVRADGYRESNYTYSNTITVEGEKESISNIRWGGTTLQWDAFPGATDYYLWLVKKQSDGIFRQVGTAQRARRSTFFDFSEMISTNGYGEYMVTVQAVYGYENNPVSLKTDSPIYKSEAPAAYTITVTGDGNPAAYYSGTPISEQEAGLVVALKADSTYNGRDFDKWVSNDVVISDSEKADAAYFTMPAKAVTVTATYKNATPPVFEFTTQPQSGTAKKSEGYSFSWTISDTPDYYNLQVLWDGSWGGTGDTFLNGSTGTVPYVEAICTGNTSKYRIHAQKGAQSIYSDEFTVTWTDDTTPPVFEFTTQPQSGTAKKSEGYSFSWTISDTPDYYNLQVLWDGSWGGTGDTFLNGSTGTVPYVEAICTGNTSKYRIHAQKGVQSIYSDEFTVTWTDDTTPPVFEFTTQPQSGTAKKSEGYSFSWTISDTPDYYNLLVLWDGSWGGTGDTFLNGSTGTVPYVEAICTGNTSKYQIYAQKGAQSIYSDEFTVTWTDDTTPPAPTYTIIAGANGEWTKGSTTGLSFTSDAPFAKFDSVQVDGSTIAAANYTAVEGSTKITLAPAYLETLSVGSHSIKIVSKDGSASTNFTVKAAAQPPVPAKYTVSFNMNGHGSQVNAQTVESGSKATKPVDPTASGYTFGGWYADAAFSAAFDFNTAINANTTVYAKWTKIPPLPKTGDSSNMVLWIALLLVSGGALAGTAVHGRKKKYSTK